MLDALLSINQLITEACKNYLCCFLRAAVKLFKLRSLLIVEKIAASLLIF